MHTGLTKAWVDLRSSGVKELSLSGHIHSGYASSSHTHSGYAASSHNHDSVYSKLSHIHTGYCQIQTGYYTGNDKYGSSNKNTITFDFVPMVWGMIAIIRPQANDAYANIATIFPWGITSDDGFSARNTQMNNGTIHVSYNESTVSYYSNNATNQWNYSAYTYYWFGIG